VARRQSAKTLELRAAMRLSRLWQQQSEHHEAHDLLAGLYNWCTEGFDSLDLRETRLVLEAA
jgi:predicted ATPase